MDEELTSLLDDLYARGRVHDAGQADRLHRWRNLEPETARLLAVLVRALPPRRMLELGTSNGYSTIWLADAARAVGVRLTSVDIDESHRPGSRERATRRTRRRRRAARR